MAYAKELTIALGQTVFAGDSQSEERITSQEARVEVTYVLERDDMDVPLLASVKAAEVQHALCAARQQLHRQQEAPDVRPIPSPANGHGSDFPFKPGASAANSTATHSASSTRANGAAGKQGNGYSRSTATQAAASEDQADCITQAQKLAIRSMFTRLSMNEPQARALVHEQCGKWALEGLTKEEAKQLLHSLQQGEREHTGRD